MELYPKFLLTFRFGAVHIRCSLMIMQISDSLIPRVCLFQIHIAIILSEITDKFYADARSMNHNIVENRRHQGGLPDSR